MRPWFWRRKAREAELDEEVRAHLDMAAQTAIERGAAQKEAERAARREFGNMGLMKEVTRDGWGWRWLEDLVEDVLYGLRMQRKNPGFAATAILTLALGIGANTAIFSVVDAILLRPLPYREPDRLVRIWESSPKRDVGRNSVNPRNFLDWHDHADSFESMAAIASLMTNLSIHGQPIAVPGMLVTPEFFSVLRVQPLLGRTFNAADGIPGQDHGVILSYELWQSQFGADPGIVGEKIDVNGGPGDVIGVMPKGFSFPGIKAEVWTPLALTAPEWREGGRFLTAVARLKAGITLEQARQDMLRVANFTAQARPEGNKDWSASVFPMLEDTTEGVRRPLWVLLAAVGFLLLIACANVANLLLMRGAGRVREIAVRSALGAARSRIIQQLLVESVLFSLAGMILGLPLAHAGLGSLLALLPQGAPLPRSESISIDEPVLVFTFLASLFTAIVFGLVPAMRLSRVDLQKALKQGGLRGGAGGHQTLRRSFVVAEVSLALVLSVGAGLMLRSFARLVSVDPGFSREHLLTMHIWTSPARYHDDLARSQYFARILAEIRHSPGVHAAGSTHILPLTNSTSGSCFWPAEQPAPTPAEAPSAQFLIISAGYFQAMGIPILSGRDFEDHDTFHSPPAAIVNHAFVSRFFPGQDILGKRLRVCWTIEKPVEIVGIVADARQADLRGAPEPTIFLSNSQAPMYFATLVVRAVGDPRQIANSVQAAVHRADPDQAVSDIRTMETVFSDSVASPRFQSILLLAFAGLALALSLTGVYGVVSYSVSERTNEMGIRVALGALSADLVRLVLREALALGAIALAVGLAGSLALTRVLKTLLFEITPTDPITLAAACSVILGVSVLAAVLPARRASRIDPMVALRYE